MTLDLAHSPLGLSSHLLRSAKSLWSLTPWCPGPRPSPVTSSLSPAHLRPQRPPGPGLCALALPEDPFLHPSASPNLSPSTPRPDHTLQGQEGLGVSARVSGARTRPRRVSADPADAQRGPAGVQVSSLQPRPLLLPWTDGPLPGPQRKGGWCRGNHEDSESACLGSSPSSTTSWLCDLGQVSEPL